MMFCLTMRHFHPFSIMANLLGVFWSHTTCKRTTLMLWERHLCYENDTFQLSLRHWFSYKKAEAPSTTPFWGGDSILVQPKLISVITIQSNLSKLLVSWPRPLRGGQELFIDIVCLFVYSLLSCLLFVVWFSSLLFVFIVYL